MLRFIHITDLHFWRIVCNPFLLLNKRFLGNLNLALRRKHQLRPERAPSFLETMARMDITAVLVGGDLTTTATEVEYTMAADFLRQLRDLGMPLYLVPGNHDCYTFEAERHRRWMRYFGEYGQTPYEPQLTRLSGNGLACALLQLPTARPNLISSRGHIACDNVERACALLREVGDMPLLTLAHYPLLTHTASYHLSSARRLGNAVPLRQILGNYGRPLLYLSGHVHRGSHTLDPRYPNIEQITTPALFYEKSGHTGGFTEIEVSDAGVVVYPWVFRGEWTRLPKSLPTPPRPA